MNKLMIFIPKAELTNKDQSHSLLREWLILIAPKYKIDPQIIQLMFSFEEQGKCFVHWNKVKNPIKFTFPKLGSPKDEMRVQFFGTLE